MSVAPWAEFWDRHMLLLWWPALRPLVGNAFVRGAVTGVGLVTLVAGVTELGTWFFPRRGASASAPVPVVDAASHGPSA